MGTRLILTGVLCGFWLAANANTAHAQATLSGASCTVGSHQAVGNPVVTWQVGGRAMLDNLPAGVAQVTATYIIEKQVNGSSTWDTVVQGTLYTALDGGGTTLDSGFHEMTAPQQGDRYRLRIKARYYIQNAVPVRSENLGLIESPALMPVR
jgi:hypothetical protein